VKKLLILLLATLLGLGIVIGGMACNNTDNEDTSINIQQLRDGISVAVEGMDTYQYTVTLEAQATMETDTGTEESQSSSEMNGIVDNTNQKMHLTMSTESEMSQGTYSMEMERYIIDNMVYAKMVTTGMPEQYSQWTKELLTSEPELWEENPVSMQIGLHEDTEMEILGSEKVNGVECWIVKLIPSLDMYSEIVGEEMEDLSPEELSERVSIKLWFAKDTYYLMKAEMEWTIVDSWGSSTTIMDTVCSHYNESVSIVLPEEAKAAEWAE